MKKLIFLLIIASIIVGGCGGKKEDSNNSTNNNEQSEQTNNDENNQEDKTIAVEKGLMDVIVTIPADFMDDELIETDELVAEAKNSGAKDIKVNDDGSLTYKLSKSDHKKMMQEINDSMIETIEEFIHSDDFASIKDISYNKQFTKFTLIVDQEQFEDSFDGFIALSLGISGMLYQLFDGIDPDKYSVTIDVQDATTNKVFSSVSYPDAFDDLDNLLDE